MVKKSTNNLKDKPAAIRITAKQRQIIDTRKQHPDLSLRQLATVCDTDHAYVSRVLQSYGISKQSIDEFKECKADILEGLSSRLLSSISNEDIQKASIQQRIVGAGILLDKANDAKGLSRVIPMVTINMISPVKPVEVIDAEG
jgi:hypothetical protein